MHFEDTVVINAPQELVWQTLTNPEQVSQCAPGINSLEIIDDGRKFRAGVEVGLGSVKAKFIMEVEWTSLESPHHAVLSAHGTTTGSAVDVTSEMTLVPEGVGSTNLQWETDVHIVGTIASIAMRFAPSITKKLAAEFFENVKGMTEK